MAQENLLPGTDAITRGTIEEVPYRGKWLVRWKDQSGVVLQRKFDSVDESHEFFLVCVNQARAAARESRER